MDASVVDIATFIRRLEAQFDPPVAGTLLPGTPFRDLAEWTSLQALIVVVSFEHEYGVTINTDELEGATTVEDLHQAVLRRLQR